MTDPAPFIWELRKASDDDVQAAGRALDALFGWRNHIRLLSATSPADSRAEWRLQRRMADFAHMQQIGTSLLPALQRVFLGEKREVGARMFAADLAQHGLHGANALQLAHPHLAAEVARAAAESHAATSAYAACLGRAYPPVARGAALVELDALLPRLIILGKIVSYATGRRHWLGLTL